nr:MAG TPA: hypothetical protein [Caudoviricetes sp.]
MSESCSIKWRLNLKLRMQCRSNANTKQKDCEKGLMKLPDCNYCMDEICVNADCPVCTDYCPVPDTDGVCRYEDRRV